MILRLLPCSLWLIFAANFDVKTILSVLTSSKKLAPKLSGFLNYIVTFQWAMTQKG